MNITLKQTQIEQALRMYVASEGINLANRSFGVHFTAGRRGAGLSAEIEIGEAAAVITKPLADLQAITPVYPQGVRAVLAEQESKAPEEPAPWATATKPVDACPTVEEPEPEPAPEPEVTVPVTAPISLFA